MNENNPVIEKGNFFQEEVLEGDMVREITEEEYEQLTLEEIPPIELNSANIDDNATLEGLAINLISLIWHLGHSQIIMALQ